MRHRDNRRASDTLKISRGFDGRRTDLKTTSLISYLAEKHVALRMDYISRNVLRRLAFISTEHSHQHKIRHKFEKFDR